jgi:hypothetical protein
MIFKDFFSSPIQDYPVSMVNLILHFINTVIDIYNNYKEQKLTIINLFYSLIKLLSAIFWGYLFLYFEPNILITTIRYIEFISVLIFVSFKIMFPLILKKMITVN